MRKGPEEIEVKLRVADRAAVLRLLKRLGARLVRPRVHEMNTLFDTNKRDLQRRGQLVRVRVERPAGRTAKHAGGTATLTYKGPVHRSDRPRQSARGGDRQGRRHKVREEREVRVVDAEALAAILEAVGLRPRFRYEKYRSTFRVKSLAGLLVEFDETPLGDFLELEGRPAAIDRAAALLGYVPGDYVVKGYGGLWLESLGFRGRDLFQREPISDSAAPDMLFSRGKRSSSSLRSKN